jgi:hypothetical protein
MIPSKAGYRYGQDARDQQTMDYLAFIARVTSHDRPSSRPFPVLDIDHQPDITFFRAREYSHGAQRG